MAPSESGKDGQYRMVVEDKYKKLAKTRTDAKIFAVLVGFYGLLKLGLSSIPSIFYGEMLEPVHIGGVLAVLFAFAIFAFGSGGGKAHLEKKYVLWFYVLFAACLGTKAVLDMFNNPLARASLMMKSPPVAQPYDHAVAKLLVQKLDLDPKSAIYDVDIVNLAIDVLGSFSLLASSAATGKFLLLKSQPGKTVKKTS